MTKTTFNKETKHDILHEKITKKCCKRSFLLGLLLFGQLFCEKEIRLVSETEQIINEAVSMIKAASKLDVSEFKEELADSYRLDIRDGEICEKLLEFFGYTKLATTYTILQDVFLCDRCKAEFVKGAFLSCGNVSSPEKRYHLEMTVSYFNLSRELLYLLKTIDLEAKYTKRTSNYVIYYKESDKIVDFLGLVGATRASFEFCEKIIERDVRNNINRIVNCEAANMSKQLAATSKQRTAINKVLASPVKDKLSFDLLTTARLRIENPYISLSALAELHDPPITKSCVNRRLNKLMSIADEL